MAFVYTPYNPNGTQFMPPQAGYGNAGAPQQGVPDPQTGSTAGNTGQNNSEIQDQLLSQTANNDSPFGDGMFDDPAQESWRRLQALLEKQNEWFEKQMAFNSSEAQKNRDWQENLYKNYYQNTIEDMQKAGLNPVNLFGNFGGQVVPSGGSASTGAPNVPGTIGDTKTYQKTLDILGTGSKVVGGMGILLQALMGLAKFVIK